MLVPSTSFAAAPVSRRDGFLMMWASLRRPAAPAKSAFTDLPDRPDNGSLEIDFAASRGLINDDADEFRPDDPLTLGTALTWLLRTRSVAKPDDIQPDDLGTWMEKYPIASIDGNLEKPLTDAELLDLMRALDKALVEEIHEVSFYSEKFQGKGTSSGEPFDMYAMTAAHKTFPFNTLVKVTNLEDGKSVTVRINDRGPFVEGRDMDLSFAAFTSLVPRSRGKLKQVTFERLGDVTLLSRCGESTKQQRIARKTVLTEGVPHAQPVGKEVRLTSESSFVVRGIEYPDGNSLPLQDWILPGESFTFTPAVAGTYRLILGSGDGKRRTMDMEAVECGA